MYTLPLTCKQVLFTGLILLIGLGIAMTLLGLEEQGKVETSWLLVSGSVIIITMGAFGIAFGIVTLQEWLSNHVKCRCSN